MGKADKTGGKPDKKSKFLKKLFSFRNENGKISIMKLIIKSILIFILVSFVSFAGLYIITPDVDYLKKENPTITKFIERRNEERKERGLKPAKIKYWVKYRSFPEHLVNAVRIAEDDAFFQHSGFDFKQIQASLIDFITFKKSLRGGSTITQQLAKNLFVGGKRSILRKLSEAALTIKLERSLSKKRIIELYLNVIEFGDGIYGIEAASRYYFHKSTSQLSLDETLFLAAIIKKPLFYQKNRNAKSLKYRKQIILERMSAYDYI